MEIGKYVGGTDYIEEVAAYIRVSSNEQKMHGISLAAQEEKLKEYAEKNGLRIVEFYKDEGVSGKKIIRKRPELQRMIKDAQKGKFKRIIFIKLDRFFRSVAEYHECMKAIDPVIWTATEEKYDLATANGRAFVNMKLTINELESDTAGERTRLTNEYKIKTGLPLFGTPSMPFCYSVEQPAAGERHKHIAKRDRVIMEDLIAHVFANHSVRAAMLYINNKYDRSFAYNTIMNALKNPMIYGAYRDNPNYCDPYMSKEMFDQMQKIITRNPRTSHNEHSYIFTGLIKCPGCGNRLTGTMHVVKRNGVKKYVYYNYRCGNHRINKRCDFGKCVFEASLEDLLLDKLELIIAGKKATVKEMRSTNERVSKYNVSELQAELDRLNYSFQKGRVKVEEYDKRYDEIMEQIEAANEEHAEMDKEPDYEKIEAVLTSDWKIIYMELDDDHRRAFWRSFIDEIQIVDNWSKYNKEIKDIIFF